jgi:hypothetical protein
MCGDGDSYGSDCAMAAVIGQRGAHWRGGSGGGRSLLVQVSA